MSPTFPATWSGLVDDAAIFPPGDVPLPDAIDAHLARRDEWYADLVGSFVVTDTKVPEVRTPLPLAVVVSGGAGGVEPALRLTKRGGHELSGVEIAPRVAGQVVEGGLRLKFRTGGLEAHLFPASHALARWIDAALDRETPFKCTAGLHNAIRHTGDDGFEHHGFLNLLVATVRAFDGATTDEVVALLEDRDPDSVVAAAANEDLARGRRWFTSFGSCSVTEPLDDLLALGLLEKP